MVDRIPPDAIGLTLAHHGLVVWGDDAEQAHAAAGAGRRADRRVHRHEPARPAAARTPSGRRRRRREERRRLAEIVLPAVRGSLSPGRPVNRTG